MSSPSETQVQQAASASNPAPVGSGECIMAAASQVKEIGQWMLENHPQRLVERGEAQALRIAELERQQEVNQREIATLRSELAEAQRAGKRQAAPFRIAQQKRKQHCKRPGRKAGHPGTWRECPADDAVDEHIEVPLERCPQCGDTLDAAGQRVINKPSSKCHRLPCIFSSLRQGQLSDFGTGFSANFGRVNFICFDRSIGCRFRSHVRSPLLQTIT
ncbi:MAG TPA: hypothetical protein ACFE0H_05895 [Elainellaceae cyanobacterium]